MFGRNKKTDASVNAPKQEAPVVRMALEEFFAKTPDVPDPFQGVPTPPPEPQPEPEPVTPVSLLADYIRKQSKLAQLVPLKAIPAAMGWDQPLPEEETPVDVPAVLEGLTQNEACQDMRTIKGEKDCYYYSKAHMTDNYAMIAALVLDQNLPRTVAEMVRFNLKTYRYPTPAFNFTRSPYFYTKVQIENIRRTLANRPEFEDIGEVITGNNKVYFYCKNGMTERYARALAEDNEKDEWGDYED